MCDTMEVSYGDGDIVWVKLGSCWWPGEVWALDKLPNEMTKSFRKTPIAVVKFFEEDSFEYVKNANLIFKYNCSRKNEFIKKGMDLHRGKSHMSHMDKFPTDVVQAERLTNGDEDILQSEQFSAVEARKTSYAGIFGTPAKTPPVNSPLKRGRYSGSAKRKSDSSPGSQQKITHPRIIQKFLKGTSDYKAHILVQEPKREETPATPDSLKRPYGDSDVTPVAGESSPRTPPGNSTPAPGTYACHACSFTATRLNVMILHNKSHSAGFVPYTPPKKHKIKTSPIKSKSVKPESTPGRSSTGTTDKKPRKPRNIAEGSVTDEIGDDIAPVTAKRKGGKIKDKEVKKPKTDIEIKNSLLADWSEDSDESMDILSSLKLTENQTAETEKPEEAADDGADKPAQKDEDKESEAGPAKVTENVGARKYASCFDFDDDDDTELPIESLGRKIPRISGKSDDIKKSVDSERAEDPIDRLAGKESSDAGGEETKQAESRDLDAEIDSLLQETAVPQLPSLPGDLKLGENFQKGKAIKFPDKERDGAERLPIFKTKTFFRSRHSRSQDAIEKYVADNVGADKRPTYMEDAPVAPTPADGFASCESDSEPVAAVPVVTPPAQEKPPVAEVKMTKLAPKIMLKKMKIIMAPKKESTPPLSVPEVVLPKKIAIEELKKSPVKPIPDISEDKWSSENLDKLLETDSLVDEKKMESYGTTDDLLGTIEEVPAGIFHNADASANHVDTSPKKIHKSDENDKDDEVSNVIPPEETVISVLSDVQPQIKPDNVPTESDLQIAEALINLPARAGSCLMSVEKSSNPPDDTPPVQGNAMEFNESDPSLNAAESLVRMSETFASEPVPSSITPNAFTGAINEPEQITVLPDVGLESTPIDNSLNTSQPDILATSVEHVEDISIADSPNLSLPEVDVPSKVITPKIMSPKGREKILNFNETAGLPPKGQKQKVIIRRTAVPKIQRSGGDRFGDTSHEKLVLSNKTVAGQDGNVQTFTIETPASEPIEPSLPGRIDKVKKFFPAKQKLIIKPRGAVITSTGMILHAAEPKEIKRDEDILFDINSMPIVLSEEILPEALGTAVGSQETAGLIKISDVPEIIKKPETDTVTKILSPVKKYNAEPTVSKPSSNFVLKPVMEKSASPNILSKSKVKSYKNLILMDKQAAVEQKFPKQEDPKEATGKIVKTGPASQGLKTEKYIIVPSGGKMTSGERTQKIILNPQTGKGQVLLGRVNDLAQAENFPGGKPQKTVAKIVQTRSPNAQSSGNTIMILTNAQGIQSKLVITSEHQRLFFPKKSIQTTAITPQSVVTSKGTILSPIATNRNKNINVTSQSIIAPRGQMMNPVTGNVIVSGSGQLVPSRLLPKKSPAASTKGQLIMTNNPNARTFVTGRPGQTILTSKGQLITQSSVVTSQSKMSSVVKTTTVLSQPGRQLKLLKTSPPAKPSMVKSKQGLLQQMSDKTGIGTQGEPTTLLLKSSPGKGQTIIRAPGERPLVIPQRGGVLQLTVAQFEHMQKTGRIVHKSVAPKAAVPPPRQVTEVSPKGQNQKFIIQKYTNSKRTAEQAGVKQKGLNAYTGNVPPLALIQSESPMKRQKLRELLTTKPEVGAQMSRTSEHKAPIIQTKPRLTVQPQPMVTADRHPDRLSNTYQKSDRIAPQPEIIPAVETAPAPIPQEMPEVVASPAESQLLAVPGENFGGPPDSFFLCVEENGTLTPVNNQPLVLENNQLVPMVTEPPPPPRLRIEEPVAPLPLPPTLPGEPAEGQTPGIILNTGDQQILLDRQTLLGLLSGEGQQLVTADGQRLILQGDVQQLISALAGNPEIAGLLSGGQQILLDASDAAQPAAPPVDTSIGNDFLFPRGIQPSANQDILAAALAGTDVFQQEPLVSDSLNVVPGGHDGTLADMDSMSPDFQNLNASVSVHSHVSETSSTLNQPIMSPLEVPTKRRAGGRTDGSREGIPSPPKNLEDSLAGIGVTAPSVPTSLDLPITVTDPRIAPKVSVNPLSLSCGVVYQSSSTLSNSMLSPGVRMSDADSSRGRYDYTYDGYCHRDTTDKIGSVLSGKSEYIHKKSSSKLGSDPILSSQAERAKREATVAPSMPVLSSSMPRLDDSSSDGYADDHPRPPAETVQSKTYSPISMPLLTEDAVDELTSDNRPGPNETPADAPREDPADSYISTGEGFAYSETKSMPVLMEPEPAQDTDIIIKDTDVSNDNVENVETTDLQLNELEQSDSYLHQEPGEVVMPDEEQIVDNSKTENVETFVAPMPIQSSAEPSEVHNEVNNQEIERVSDVAEEVTNSDVNMVAEVNSFSIEETVTEVDNYPEELKMSEDSLEQSNVTEITSRPEDLSVSDVCIAPEVQHHAVDENLPILHEVTDTVTSVLSEGKDFADEPDSNVVESIISSEEMILDEPQSATELPECNEEVQYSGLESERLSPSRNTDLIEPEIDCSTQTHNDVDELISDRTEMQSRVIEPENSKESSYIAESEHDVAEDVNIETENSNCSQDYSYHPEDGFVMQQNDIAQTDNCNIETETRVFEDGVDNVEESDRIEPMEIVADEISTDNVTGSEAVIECKKQYENFENQNSDFEKRNENFEKQNEDFEKQNEDFEKQIEKQNENFEKQNEDFEKQIEKQNEDLERQTENFEKQNEDFLKQNENFVNQNEDFVNQNEDFDKQNEDFDKQNEVFEKQDEFEKQNDDIEKPQEDFEMTDSVINETDHESSLPVISNNGDGINEYHETATVDLSSATLNNEEHTNDDLTLDSDVIEPSSVPSEAGDSPGRPITPYRLVHTPNDEICLPHADSDSHMDRLHVSCDPEQASLSPNLNSTPSPELTQNYSDSSSDDSMEIPLQPSISVSQHLVQTMMCTDERQNDDSEKKSPRDSVRGDDSFTFDDER